MITRLTELWSGRSYSFDGLVGVYTRIFHITAGSFRWRVTVDYSGDNDAWRISQVECL
jgi:hypothetical protein